MSKENPLAEHDPATCYQCGAKNNESKLVRWQKVREIWINRNSVRTSPYWDYLERSEFKLETQDFERKSPKDRASRDWRPRANPDVISDSDSGPGPRPNFCDQEEKQSWSEKQWVKIDAVIHHLTRKQIDVLTLWKQGKTLREIGQQLKIDYRNVQKIQKDVVKKLKKLLVGQV